MYVLVSVNGVVRVSSQILLSSLNFDPHRKYFAGLTAASYYNKANETVLLRQGAIVSVSNFTIKKPLPKSIEGEIF